MNETGFSVYPNPTTGDVGIRIKDGSAPLTTGLEFTNAELEIYNLFGEKVYSSPLSHLISHLSLDLPKGMYFLNIASGDEKYYTKLVMQ